MTEPRYPLEETCDEAYGCDIPEHQRDIPRYDGTTYRDCTRATDDGTMQSNVAQLTENIVGHKIVKAETRKVEGGQRYWSDEEESLVLTLDDGRKVALANTDDCCAYTKLESFLLHPEAVDHMILGVGTTDGFTKWHIYADFGDVMELEVGWSSGNPFFYGYGFDIFVVPTEEEK